MKPSSTPTPVLRSRTARGADRLRQLQTTAAEMFLERGYEGVSVDGLIDRVGGSRRNVYGAYGGKQGLFVATMRGLCEEVSAQLDALPMARADARDGLLLYGRRLLELLLQPRMLEAHRLMIAEGQRFPEQARSLCQSGRDKAAQALGRWLAEHQARGALRGGPPPVDLAQHFIQLVVGGPQMRALVGELPPGWSAAGIRRHVAFTVDLFLQGAQPPAAAPAPQPARPAPRPAARKAPR